MPSEREQRRQTHSESGPYPHLPLGHIGKSQTVATSDSLDVRSPIPLTRADLQVRLVLPLTFILCNLSPVSAWHTPCARSKFYSCSEFRGRYRERTHEQSEGRRSVVCDVFSRNRRRSNHTGAHFLNRVTWSSRPWVVGLVALALLAMAPPTGSGDDDEADLGPSAIAIVASRVNGSLSSRSTTQTQQHEPNTVTTAPIEPRRRVRALEAKISWHAGRSMLKSFCLLRC